MGQKTATIIRVQGDSIAVHVPASWFGEGDDIVLMSIRHIDMPSATDMRYHVRPIRMAGEKARSCRIAVRNLDGFRPKDRVIVTIERDENMRRRDDAEDAGREVQDGTEEVPIE